MPRRLRCRGPPARPVVHRFSEHTSPRVPTGARVPHPVADPVPDAVTDELPREADPARLPRPARHCLPAAAAHAETAKRNQPKQLGKQVTHSPTGEPVSVVVCTLGRQPGLRATVDAILAQTYPNLDVLVVDNDPGSGRTADLLTGVTDRRLRLVPEPVRGLSVARNTGLRTARGDLVAYTDDDALPDPTWIAELVSVIGEDGTGVVGCVTGRVVAAETTTSEQQWFEDYGDFDKGSDRIVWSMGPPPESLPGIPGPHSPFFPYTAGEMGTGNNMLFRTAGLRVLGGFDEALGTGSPARGGEDLDIYRRVILAGQVLVYTPDAVIRHHHRDTQHALRTQMFGYGAGMAASLTKVLVQGGPPALALLRRLPRGVYMLVWPSSAKNEK